MPRLEEALPKYLQVANHYRDQIVSGSLAEGSELPSERQLAVEWDISRPTATRALAALRSLGLVESRQGSGTFVRGHVRFNRGARDRYLRSRDAGRIYGPGERAEIVEARLTTPPDWIATELGLKPGELAIRRERVTYTDEEPSEISVSWLHPTLADVAPRLLDVERIRTGSVAYVAKATGRKPAYARDQVAARLGTVDERRQLALTSRSAAVLVIRHVVYDDQGEAMECVEAAYPPDRWTFEQQYSML
jgi:DNA-binding GntR family transcriptional regulator